MYKTKIVAWFLILTSFLISLLMYPKMPSPMASHWGIKGEVNGYSSKVLALFILPVISVFLYLLFYVLPKIDPLKENVSKFKKQYDWFIVAVIGFLVYIQFLTIIWNLGFSFNFSQLMTPAFSLLIYCSAILLDYSKRNWFIGIRTPWTLSNDNVWTKTHKLGSRLFKIGALISLLGIFVDQLTFYFILIPVIVISVYLFFYSYIVFKQASKKEN